jgi:hypothetical protein
MKFVVSILLIALLAFAMGLYMPWWTIAIAAFIVPLLIYQRPGLSFLSGFIAIFLLWALLASVINSSNNSILAPRIAMVLPLGGSVFTLITVTAVTGALIGGFASLTGSFLRKIR